MPFSQRTQPSSLPIPFLSSLCHLGILGTTQAVSLQHRKDLKIQGVGKRQPRLTPHCYDKNDSLTHGPQFQKQGEKAHQPSPVPVSAKKGNKESVSFLKGALGGGGSEEGGLGWRKAEKQRRKQDTTHCL